MKNIASRNIISFILTACTVAATAATPVYPADDDTPEGEMLDLWADNTSSNYAIYTTTRTIVTGSILNVRTARYTEFRPQLRGAGTLRLYCGGERTYAGQSDDKAYPDWAKFTGDVHIYPYTKKAGCGFYGLIMNSGGKTFNPEDIAASLEKTNSQLMANSVTLHQGATLATPNGVRAVRIGHLDTEEGSQICGSIKGNASYAGYYVVGHKGTDATIAGRIAPLDSRVKVGLVKEGPGSYWLTGNDNMVSGAVRVLEGALFINNDAARAKKSKMQGAIGAIGTGTPGIYVFQGAIVGGTGHSASIIDLYGTLNPGDYGVGTLTLADYVTATAVDLRLRPTSRLIFEIASAHSHDSLSVSGALDYWNIRQDFATSDDTPVIYIEPSDNAALQVGDTFTLITAKGKTARTGKDWNFRLQTNGTYTWQLDEQTQDGVLCITATVTSLDGNGGDNPDQPGETPDDNPYDNDPFPDDDFDETKDTTPLRTYAQALGKQIGVATPCWSYNLNDYSLAQTARIGREFNLVVSENGTKYDALEPSQGRFDYNLSDKAYNLARHYKMDMRGHTFVWHKQNPGWLTDENGTKNPGNLTRSQLLDILKNHIFTVAAHYKGKITEWDVVNECLSDNQTAIRSNPDAYDLRPSIWQTVIGEDYIDSAFVWAHQADPSLKLILNDYGVEFKGTAKTEAMYNLARRLLKDGIPLHGIGLQCHLDAGSVDALALARTIESYETLGLECIITELDMGIDDTSSAALEQQARDYAAIARVWLSHSNCPRLVLWGLLDSDSWRGSHPLLFDGSVKPKPAYYAIHRCLRQTVASPVRTAAHATPAVTGTQRYTVSMQPVGPSYRGVVIELTRYADGTTSTRKFITR